jgi:hypothetical protein
MGASYSLAASPPELPLLRKHSERQLVAMQAVTFIKGTFPPMLALSASGQDGKF